MSDGNINEEWLDEIDDEETLRNLWINQHKAEKENGKWFGAPGDLNR